MKPLPSRRAALLAFATALSLPSAAFAQRGPHAYQTWLGLFVNGPIAGRVYLQSDFHYRGYDDFSPYWALVRPGVGYRLAPGMFITAGYAWTPSWRQRNPGEDLPASVDEHRVWEQWQGEWPIAGGAASIQLRTRLEQRWRPAVSSDVGLRLRQMVRVTVPLGGRWLLAAWDEFFLALNDTGWGQGAGLDQNRFFAGVGVWAVVGALRFELGYFNQLLNPPSGGKDRANHALMLNTYVTWR